MPTSKEIVAIQILYFQRVENRGGIGYSNYLDGMACFNREWWFSTNESFPLVAFPTAGSTTTT
jgi:hypothetical protein